MVRSLNKKAYHYHSRIALIALIFNPVFAISDYFVKPNYFLTFLFLRLAICLLIAIVLINKIKFKRRPEFIALVPFLGISLENAYMLSVMNINEIQQHTFAYMALFIGAGMFVVWRMLYSLIVVLISFIITSICIVLFSELALHDILINGGILLFVVALFSIFLIQTRYKLIESEIYAQTQLYQANKELAHKNEAIVLRNKEIKDSLNYASRIQFSFLPNEIKLNNLFEEHFVLYKPKDIVSGDFFWASSTITTPKKGNGEEVLVFAVADCTGHGVPGALMSIIGNTLLNQSLKAKEVNSPADALNFLDTGIKKNLSSIKDGMDIAFCAFNKNSNKLYYAGAKNPLYVVKNGILTEIKGDKIAIGNEDENNDKKFTNHEIELTKGDMIYLFTDGYADQFGGPKSSSGGKKFKYNRFKKLIQDINKESVTVQKEILEKEFNDWKGYLEQVDDVLIFGVKV